MNVQLQASKAQDYLLNKWIYLWLANFVDQQSGGFFERLGADCKPLAMGYKRLVTQCRQMYVCAHSYVLTKDQTFLSAAQHGYDFINTAFVSAYPGGFHFSVKEDGSMHDQSYDLYAHAFIIFSLTHYYTASNSAAALDLAKKTLKFIEAHFRSAAHKGYYEALDVNLQPIARVRRQNPHMHLFEACITMYEVTEDLEYLTTADYILELFEQHFFDHNTSTLGEFFDDSLAPDAATGNIIEPGHHFEWIWLLHKRLTLKPAVNDVAKLELTMIKLFDWARTNGINPINGGIYNEVDRKGVVLNSSKRIWAVTEALKAYAIMLQHKLTDQLAIKQELSNLFDILLNRYVKSDSIWVEICNHDLSEQTDFMPGTTTYHIFSGIVQTHSLLVSGHKK